eukprot:g22796.t1
MLNSGKEAVSTGSEVSFKYAMSSKLQVREVKQSSSQRGHCKLQVCEIREASTPRDYEKGAARIHPGEAADGGGEPTACDKPG